MELLIPLLLVLLLVAGLVTFMVLNATKKSGAARASEDTGPEGRRFSPEDDDEEPAEPASERLANREP